MILVTGGTGFLGNGLVRQLRKEDKVRIFTRQNIPHAITGNITDYHSVYDAVKDADVVFHLAAESDHFAPYEQHYRTTIAGTRNVMKAAEKTGVKVVYMSSAVLKNKNKTNYVLAKTEAEKIAKSYWGKIEVPIIRASLIYDKTVLEKLKKLTYLPFPCVKQKIHLSYKESVVRALIGAMKYGKSEIYEVGDKKPVLLTELVKELAAPRPVLWLPPQTVWLLIGLSYPVYWLSRLFRIRPPITPTFIRYLFEDRQLDTKKAVRKLRYKPVDTLEMVRKLK
jgi:nucleoside-diphosphate-sugar epimerase